MSRQQIVAAFVGATGALVGAGLGLGPLAYRVLDARWVPGVPLVAALAVVLGIAALVLAAVEWSGSSALAFIAAASVAILGATSVVLGVLAGGLIGLAALGLGVLVEHRAHRGSRPGDLLVESARLHRAARRARGAESMLLSLADRVGERAESYADQRLSAQWWQTADVASHAKRSAREVAATRHQMLERRDLLASEGLRRVVQAELLSPRGGRISS